MAETRGSEPRPIGEGLRAAQERLRTSVARRVEPARPGEGERAALEQYQKSEEATRGALTKAVRVPPRYATLKIDEELIPRRALDFLETWRGGGSLLLAGPPGSGKTATVVHLLRRLWLSGEIHYEINELRTEWVSRWTAPSMRFFKVRRIYESVFARDRSLLRAALEVDVLALDDWGAAYEHDWPLAELDGLIDDRWDRELPTIVTTNLPPKGGPYTFEELAGRAFSRLCGAPGPGLVIMDRRDLRRSE